MQLITRGGLARTAAPSSQYVYRASTILFGDEAPPISSLPRRYPGSSLSSPRRDAEVKALAVQLLRPIRRSQDRLETRRHFANIAPDNRCPACQWRRAGKKSATIVLRHRATPVSAARRHAPPGAASCRQRSPVRSSGAPYRLLSGANRHPMLIHGSATR